MFVIINCWLLRVAVSLPVYISG